MKDIDIKSNDGNFKLRTSAIIIKDGKILLEKSRCGDCYTFSGGHVELGEITSEAILREAKEETKLNVEIESLCCVVELIYMNKENKTNQEINYYYKLKCIDDIETTDFTTIENDKGIEKHHTFCWFDINQIDTKYLKSKEVIELLQKDINAKNEIILIDSRN